MTYLKNSDAHLSINIFPNSIIFTVMCSTFAFRGRVTFASSFYVHNL